jgi:hypothetical protein
MALILAKKGLANPQIDKNVKKKDKFNSDTHEGCWKNIIHKDEYKSISK